MLVLPAGTDRHGLLGQRAHVPIMTHMSEAVPTRDPVATARTLEHSLRGRLESAEVTVSDLSVPKAGFSNETILFDCRWHDGAVCRRTARPLCVVQ